MIQSRRTVQHLLPVPAVDPDHLVVVLSNALISVLDAVAELHDDQPGPWLELLERSLVREALHSGANLDSVAALHALVDRVRARLNAEADL